MKFFTAVAPLLLCLFSSTLAAPVAQDGVLHARHHGMDHSATGVHVDMAAHGDLHRRVLTASQKLAADAMGKATMNKATMPKADFSSINNNMKAANNAGVVQRVSQYIKDGYQRLRVKYFNYAQKQYAAGKKPIGNWILEKQAKQGKVFKIKDANGQVQTLSPWDI